jgi:hypothetical protein
MWAWQIFILAVLLIFGSGVSLGVEETGESVKLQASGVIASVDVLGGKLTVKESVPQGSVASSDQLTNFSISTSTAISSGKQPLKLSDLRSGGVVAVEYTTEGGEKIATSIAVQSPPEPTATATSSRP